MSSGSVSRPSNQTVSGSHIPCEPHCCLAANSQDGAMRVYMENIGSISSKRLAAGRAS